mmetsp:Transcript_34699/g.58424  ORF Transcript_34699/g.58424 Transcript_34699/m.58424 type:complete len:250 (+) Transcript_34699:218-967(+)
MDRHHYHRRRNQSKMMMVKPGVGTTTTTAAMTTATATSHRRHPRQGQQALEEEAAEGHAEALSKRVCPNKPMATTAPTTHQQATEEGCVVMQRGGAKKREGKKRAGVRAKGRRSRTMATIATTTMHQQATEEVCMAMLMGGQRIRSFPRFLGAATTRGTTTSSPIKWKTYRQNARFANRESVSALSAKNGSDQRVLALTSRHARKNRKNELSGGREEEGWQVQTPGYPGGKGALGKLAVTVALVAGTRL